MIKESENTKYELVLINDTSYQKLDSLNMNLLIKSEGENWHGGFFTESDLTNFKKNFSGKLQPIDAVADKEIKENSLNLLLERKKKSLTLKTNSKEEIINLYLNQVQEDKKILGNLTTRSSTEIEEIFDKISNLLSYIKDEDKLISYSELDINRINSISPERKNRINECVVDCLSDNQEILSDCRSKENVFSYISRNMVNSENVMSNYGSQNFNSEVYISPGMSPNNRNNLMSMNDRMFISQKRVRNEIEIENENDLVMSPRISSELLIKQKNEQIFNEVFNNKGVFKYKWYSVNCIDCFTIIKIRKIDKICCEFYLCKQCAIKYFSILNELIINFDIDKVKEKCVSTCFKFYYCSFCFLVDKEENLEQCQVGLCCNYFHKKCSTLVKFFSSEENHKRIFPFKEKIAQIVLSEIIKDENKKYSNPDLITMKNKIENKESLMNNFDNGKLIMILYKTNTISFYKFFVSNFIKYIFSNFITDEIAVDNFQEMSCLNHTCLICTSSIDEFTIKFNSYVRPCCTILHSSCYNLALNKNFVHLEIELLQMNSHIPFLHFKFAKEIYERTKELSMNVSKNKGKYKIIGKPELIKPNLPELCESLKIIQKLSRSEKSQVDKSYKEIPENKNAQIMKTSGKVKNLVMEKCDCVKKIITNFIQERENKNSTNNIHKYKKRNPCVSTNFKNSEFKQYIKNQGYCCKETCQNKNLKIECYAKTCESPEEFCLNRYPSNRGHYYPSLEVIKTVNRGYGLICTKLIKKGDYILEYSGEVVDFATLTENLNSSKIPGRGWYLMSIDNEFYVDASKYGNKARFINHSCNPNAYVEKWVGQSYFPRLLIFANSDIKPGTEISYNYNFSYFNKDFEMKCNCGESNCCKIMGSTLGSSNINKKKQIFELDLEKGKSSLIDLNKKDNKNIPDFSKFSRNDNKSQRDIYQEDGKNFEENDSIYLSGKYNIIQIDKSIFLRNLNNTSNEFIEKFKIIKFKNMILRSPIRQKGFISSHLSNSPLSYAALSPEKSPVSSPPRLTISNFIQNLNSQNKFQIIPNLPEKQILIEDNSKSNFSTPFLMRNISKVIRTKKNHQCLKLPINNSKPKTQISEQLLDSLKSAKHVPAEKIVKIFTYNKNHNNFSFYLTVVKKENKRLDTYKSIFTEYINESQSIPLQELKFIKKKFQILEGESSVGNKEYHETFLKKAERCFVFLVRYLLIPKISN